MNKNIIALTSLLTLPLVGMKEIANEKVMKMGDAKKASLFHDGKEFHVNDNGILHTLGSHQIDKGIRNIDGKMLNNRLATSYLLLKKSQEGTFSLKENGRLNGGGPITGMIFYGAVKVVAWVGLSGLFKKATKNVTTELDARGHHGTAVMVRSGTPFIAAHTVGSNAGRGVVGAAGGYFESLPPSAQDASTDAHVYLGMNTGASNVSVIENVAQAAYDFGNSIKKLP